MMIPRDYSYFHLRAKECKGGESKRHPAGVGGCGGEHDGKTKEKTRPTRNRASSNSFSKSNPARFQAALFEAFAGVLHGI
jgi:hypothetical protein